MDWVVAENENFMAILEEKPLVLGHCVVFPKREEDSFFDLTDDELSKIMVFAKAVAVSIKKAVPCQKIGVAIIGLQTRHAHVHLVPINSPDDLNFTRPRVHATEADLRKLASLILASLFTSHL